MHKKWLRILLSFVGVLLIGLSIGVSRLADLGTDPFTTFNLGLSNFFNIQFGTYMIISNAVGLVLVFLTAKHLIGVGTLFNIIMVGYVSDFTVNLLSAQFGEIDSLVLRIILGAIGLVVLAVGASLYIVAERGVAPYDALPVIVEQKSNGRISFRAARVISDILCIGIGFSLGATFGVITIVSGFFMGPLMQVFRTLFTNKLAAFEEDKFVIQEEN